MRIYITFGDEKFRRARNFGVWTAKHIGGFNKAIAYTPNDIDEEFKKAHDDIFSIKRGYGLWLWKAYFVYKTLVDECQDGDFLFYGDGGSFLIRNINHIEKSMGDSDVWVSQIPLQEWQFTKKDTFGIMRCDCEKYKNTPQIQGGFLYIRKTDEAVRFIKEWLELCCDLRLLHPDNIYTGQENHKGFQSHREDQSVLSLLCKKKGILAHQDPSQYGKYPEKYLQDGFLEAEISHVKEYPVCIILHRTGNLRISTVLRQIILSVLPRFVGLHLISNGKK